HVVKNGFYVKGTKLFSICHGQHHLLADLANITSIRGSHNAENALMALATLQILKITILDIEEHLASYLGLAHRMQQVCKIASILFINDSKATNAEASVPALATFNNIF
ncbi:MAG: UDP-N-acetylmuramoyl-L-alanine--D-glutamate ligase, partial [Bartonella sp.]|nr:UDP-N-acetylmuramoyl-L-alanine--D-glutamate ligase [Bartonella sp.]